MRTIVLGEHMQAVSEATASAGDGDSRPASPPTLPRTQIKWLLVGVAVALFVGAVLPPLVLTFLKPVPVGIAEEYTSKTGEGMILWPHREQPIDSALLPDDPTCADSDDSGPNAADKPLRCDLAIAPITLTHQVTTAKGRDRDEANTSSHIAIQFDGAPFAEITDDLVLDRGAAQPVPGTTQRSEVIVPPLNDRASSEDTAGSGLHYFFPFNTERRSYLYADPLTATEKPIDYVETVDIGDLQAYQFAHHGPAVRAHQGLFPLLEVVLGEDTAATWLTDGTSGPAAHFYSEDERTSRGLADDEPVTLHPYLAVDRDVFVEPDSGRLLDLHERYSVYLAADDEEAQEMSTAEPSRERTVLSFANEWDDATREAMYDATSSETLQMRILQILAWVGKAVAAVLIAWIAWLIVSYRRSLTY